MSAARRLNLFFQNVGRSQGWHKTEGTIDIGSMCYVIVTGRSLLWTLLSLAALMAVLSGLITPRWLVGPATIKETSKYSPLNLIGYRNHFQVQYIPYLRHTLESD